MTPGLNERSILDLRRLMTGGSISPEDIIADLRQRIAEREEVVGAWIALDWRHVEEQLARLETIAPSLQGPLHGIPIGVKDIYDTVGLPTCYGTTIYEGHRPAWDAVAVARLRAAGAIILGKTVTTELAFWGAGKTRHPLDPRRSPGGSSSGSAAAVADMMVPAALGSQTAASIIRPAAYCGVVGFKPSHGLISLAGVKPFAHSIDTAGVLAREVADAALIASVMAPHPPLAELAPLSRPIRIRVARTPDWGQVDGVALDCLEAGVERLVSAGARLDLGDVPAQFADLSRLQDRIMAYEAAQDFAYERLQHWDRLSHPLQTLLRQGEAIARDEYERDQQRRKAAIAAVDALFGDDDVLAAPSTVGEAPEFGQGTGDPIMSRAWTLLGLPSITLPAGRGGNGLPLGVQLAARPGADKSLLEIAAWAQPILARAQA